MRYYSDTLVRIMRGEDMPDTGWGVLSMQVRLYVQTRRDLSVSTQMCEAIRATIVAGLSADRGTPEGVAKVEATVNLLISYWTTFELYGIQAATKIAKGAV